MVVSFFVGCKSQPASNNEVKVTDLKNEMDSISYSLGIDIASSLKNQGMEELNINAMAQAFRDVLTDGANPMLDQMQARQVLTTYFNNLQATRAETLKKAGEDFLAENKNKPGVVTLSSGLQYEILVEGAGEKPKLSDRVKTHYHGTLIDGTVFDSSVQRGEPISFAVNGVIKGWTEALQLMPVGSKWKLYIPYNLAYGERGSGPTIGPYAALIFEVELLAIE